MDVFTWAKSLKITAKIGLLISTVAVGLSVVVWVALGLVYQQMQQDRVSAITWIVETVHGVAEQLEQQVQAGELTQEDGIERMRQMAAGMLYDDNEYIFAFSYDGTNVFFGNNAQLVGQNFNQMQDANGYYLVREMAKVAQTQGEGVVSYMLARGEDTEPTPKFSYVKSFRPWGLFFGTGVFMDEFEADYAAFRDKMLFWAVLVGVIASGLAVLIGLAVSRPLNRVTAATRSLSAGALDTSVPDVERGDEIGQLAQAVQVFKEMAIESERLRSEAQEHLEQGNRMHEEQLRLQADAEKTREDMVAQEQAAAERRRSEVLELADSFESEIGGIVQLMQSVVAEVADASTQLADNTQTSRTECEMAVGSAEEASSNAQTVAAAAEQLTASIREISHQLSSSRQSSAEAVEMINSTDTAVSSLADQAEQISRITNLITDIAEQTNLLALNATIEAARAGESGRGFAVVASEVKALATQTGKAATEIGEQIISVQEKTEATVERIRGVKDLVHSNDTVTSSIAAAVEEQGAATQEIVRNIQEAASGTEDVSRRITTVRQLAGEAADNAQAAGEVSGRLLDACASLDKAAGEFVGVMRTR